MIQGNIRVYTMERFPTSSSHTMIENGEFSDSKADIYLKPVSSEVIVISSDEDDDDDDVISISSESMKDNEEVLSISVNDNPLDYYAVSDEGEDDDLPDIPEMDNLNYSWKDDCKEVVNNDSYNCISSQKRPSTFQNYSESPKKLLKVDNSLPTKKAETHLQIKQQIFKSLLTGCIRGTKNFCSLDFKNCYAKHSIEGISTPIQSRSLYETMLGAENLQSFALRAIRQRAVSHSKYLCPSTLNLLLQYLIGSAENMEAPTVPDIHLGVSILYKQLNLHPPCKPGMRQIYLKMCQNWFSHLLNMVEDILQDKNYVPTIEFPKVDTTKAVSECDQLYDFANVMEKKALAKQERFLQRSKAEKIIHLSTLLRFFTRVFQSNALVWHIKHWSKNTRPFRKDISPILSEVVWGTTPDFGSVNQTVQKLFHLYSLSSKEQSLHEHLSLLVSINASILHRFEKCTYPEMGPVTREYAYRLYMTIKGSTNMESNLRSLHPDWLKLHVTSLFLDVEQPCSFFKVKERISHILQMKDTGRPIAKSFNVEFVCFQAISAMIDMMQLKSLVSETSDPTLHIIDDDDLWFAPMLSENFISSNLEKIQSTLQLPCVKSRNLFLDDFENYVYCQ